ncbi:MAG: transporter substrate-binding domain-containing protein [Sulfitobacter sp.]
MRVDCFSELRGNNVLKYLFMCIALAVGLSATMLPAQDIDKVVAANYPPLMVENDLDHPGYAVEVLREAAARAGRQIEISFLPFPRAIAEVLAGPATLMPALFFGKRRGDEFLWLAEIQKAQLRFATISKEKNGFQTLNTARAFSSIVVELGTTADDYLTEQGFTNLVRVNSPESSARMLEAGRVEAWFQDERVFLQEWGALNFTSPLVMGDVFLRVPVFLVASPMYPAERAEAYRNAIESMKADGTLDALWSKYWQN